MTSLSKFRHTAFCQCPKNLWLSVNKSEVAKEDPSSEARFEKGSGVGELAKQLLPGTVDVSVKKADGNPDVGSMLAKTQ